jgi:hypothetical protein
VVDLVSSGISRDVIQKELTTLSLQLRSQDQEEAEDTVLEVLDFLVGYCAPDQRI